MIVAVGVYLLEGQVIHLDKIFLKHSTTPMVFNWYLVLIS
jgi:hypothetical protein